MVENLHLRRNKHVYHAHRALIDSATKIFPIVPTYRSNRAHFALIIIPTVP